MAGRSAGADAGARADAAPFTVRHLAIVAVCVLALGFDLGEIALGGALSAVFSDGDEPASAAELAWLLASVYIGGALGTWPAGRLADVFGRRVVAAGLLCLLGLASVAGAASPGVGVLSLMRGVAGVGLGVLPVIIVAYLTDILPRAGRGRVIMAASALGFAGAPLLLMLLSALGRATPLGIEGWRLAVAFGGVGALACAGLFLLLPEAPRWLAAVGRAEAAEQVLASLARGRTLGRAGFDEPRARTDRTPAPGRTGPRLALLIFLCVLSPFVVMTFPVLSGAVLIERGFNLTDSLLFLALSAWGSVLGTLAASTGLDRVERPAALVICGIGMATGLTAFFLGASPLALILGSALFQTAAAVYAVTLNIYAAELFVARYRAALTGLAWGLQRGGAVIAIFLLVPVLRREGAFPVFVVMALCLAGAGLAAWFFGPRSLVATARPMKEKTI